MNLAKVLFAAHLVVLSLLIAHAAYADSKLLPCDEKQGAAESSAVCRIEIFPPTSITRLSIDTGVGGQPGTPAVPRFVAGDADESAYSVAMLINESVEVSPAELARMKAVFSRLLTSGVHNTDFALWAFASNLRPMSPFGTAPETIRLTLDSIQPKGQTIELLRSLNEVGKQLSATSSKHKIIIVATLSDVEDRAYTLPEIIDPLKAAGIRVFFVYPKRGDRALTAAQILRRISDETSGQVLQVFDQGSIQAAADYVAGFMQRSGAIIVPEGNKSSKLLVELSDGRTLTTPILAAPKPMPSAPAEPPPSGLRAAIAWFVGLPIGSKAVLVAAPVVLVALFLFVIVWAVQRRRRAAVKAAALAHSTGGSEAAGTVGEMRPVLAWLQFLESSENKEPVHQDVTRIGRQLDNDIVLSNTSVHRHHAILCREPSGVFTVMDLDTENGVLVNGKRVGSCNLKDGDLVELGEVRMRFKVA